MHGRISTFQNGIIGELYSDCMNIQLRKCECECECECEVHQSI